MSHVFTSVSILNVHVPVMLAALKSVESSSYIGVTVGTWGCLVNIE